MAGRSCCLSPYPLPPHTILTHSDPLASLHAFVLSAPTARSRRASTRSDKTNEPRGGGRESIVHENTTRRVAHRARANQSHLGSLGGGEGGKMKVVGVSEEELNKLQDDADRREKQLKQQVWYGVRHQGRASGF